MRIAFVRIDEIRNLRRALDGDVAGIALDGDGRGDFDIAEAVAGVLEDRRALIDAVRHRLDQAAHVAIGHGEQFVDAGVGLLDAVFFDHAEQIALADLAGADRAR